MTDEMDQCPNEIPDPEDGLVMIRCLRYINHSGDHCNENHKMKWSQPQQINLVFEDRLEMKDKPE